MSHDPFFWLAVLAYFAVCVTLMSIKMTQIAVRWEFTPAAPKVRLGDAGVEFVLGQPKPNSVLPKRVYRNQLALAV